MRADVTRFVFTAVFAAAFSRAFFSSLAAVSRASRAATASSSRCARNTTRANHPDPRRWAWRDSNARTAASQRSNVERV